jgi:hypothetical protein
MLSLYFIYSLHNFSSAALKELSIETIQQFPGVVLVEDLGFLQYDAKSVFLYVL